MLESIFEQDFVPTFDSDLQEAAWGIELSPEQAESVLRHIPSDFVFENHLRNALKIQTHPPLLLFLFDSTWDSFSDEEKGFLLEMQGSQVIILCSQEDVAYRMSRLATLDFLILRWPIEPVQLRQYIEKTRQSRILYQDIFRMAQEISLERELIARKNEQLDFLNMVLTHACQSLETKIILQQAAEDLSLFMEKQALFVCFWEQENSLVEADMFLPDKLAVEVEKKWQAFLSGAAQRYGDEKIAAFRMHSYPASGHQITTLPTWENIISFPMQIGNNPFGFLMIASFMASKLGQDKLVTLQSVANHLALTLKNSQRFCKIRQQADRDGLTGLANRHYFDKRLLEEFHRHQRHANELCLLMLDIDFFKRINDKYGHQAGDFALNEIGRILSAILRQSDFPARYGGEEFAVILPQTTEEQGRKLAERIRSKVASSSFKHNKDTFMLTVSIGVASCVPCLFGSSNISLVPGKLVDMADKALYRAKQAGRNRVLSSVEEEAK